MKKPVLLIMAAGLGSRYGGLKQIDPIGPGGEILLEFALMDAIAIGIEKVVIVITDSMKEDFKNIIVAKYQQKIHIELAIQSLDMIPQIQSGKSRSETRIKPWGTSHAVWCAREAVGNNSCIVMNADDFYGRSGIKSAFDFLTIGNNEDAGIQNIGNKHCIIPCPLANMLSDFGTVSRGICEVKNEYLTKIVEHLKVGRKNGPQSPIMSYLEDGSEISLDPATPVNMGLFGFQSDFWQTLDNECEKFFEEHIGEQKKEFFLPSVVEYILENKLGTFSVIMSTSPWFGMTNAQDREAAKIAIARLVSEGVY